MARLLLLIASASFIAAGNTYATEGIWGIEKIQAPSVVTFESIANDQETFAFVESKRVMLTADLPIDSLTSTGESGFIPAGTIVNSYMIVAGEAAFAPKRQGWLRLENPILGVMTEAHTLDATDSIVGHTGTDYRGGKRRDRFRGLDREDLPAAQINASINAVRFGMQPQVATDQIRVITLAPEPASALMLAAAAALVLRLARR